MSTKIYVAPYVRGPASSAAKDYDAQSNGTSNQPTSSVASPSQWRIVEKSEPTFAIEFVFLAVLVGTLAAWVANVSGTAMSVILAIDGVLACGVLIGYIVRK